MKTVEAKYKRCFLKTGIHEVEVSDMYYLRNAAKELVKINGHLSIIVKFLNKNKEVHEQMFLTDKGIKQRYFEHFLNSIGLSLNSGSPLDRGEIIGKKLYIGIQEVHYVNNDKVVIEDGEPKIEYHLFKTFPIDTYPTVQGDPKKGVPFGEFVTYKNIA